MTDFISINEAAERLGKKPGDVTRLIDSGQVRAVVLVDADSVREQQES